MRNCRLSLVLVILCCTPGLLAAQGDWRDHLDLGVEWGYTATVFEGNHYNYLSATTGARIDTRESGLCYKSNGHLYGYIGARFARFFSADARVGWAGLYEGRRMCPVTLRASYFPGGYDRDGWQTFLEGGRCLGPSFAGKPVGLGRLGGGYRLMLDRHLALDWTVSVQGVFDHPLDVYVPSRGESVPNYNLRRSDTGYVGINFTLGLSF